MIDTTKKNSSFKKYLPIGLLVVITIALMFYFKENRGSFGELVDQGRADLVTLYTENLQPFLFGSDLNNEDVFNFALYQTVPIDKERRDVLRLDNSETGKTYYQVLPNTYKPNTSNYENYLRYMAFNEQEKTELDSILESYKPELAEAILTNPDKTVAVSARLANLQKAILTDIAAYSRTVNKGKISDLFGPDMAMLDSKSALNLVDEIKRDTTKEYLVIANDTAFTSRIEFDNKEFEEKMAKLNSKLSELDNLEKKINVKVLPSNVPPPPPKFKKGLDSSYSYSYTSPADWKYSQRSLDSLNFALTELENSLKNLSFNFDTLGNNMKFGISSDSNNVSFELNFDGLGEIIGKSIEGAMKHPNNAEYWENFGAEMESLATSMVNTNPDSLKKLKEKLRELKAKKKNN